MQPIQHMHVHINTAEFNYIFLIIRYFSNGTAFTQQKRYDVEHGI